MRGLYMAEGSMLTQQARMEKAANNLSNQRTPGFKREDNVQTSFAEWLLYARDVADRDGPTPIGTMAHNVATSETRSFMGDGELEQTDRPLDLAINGNGLFQVQVDEEVLYSRDGHLFLDADGFLVNSEGDMILGEDGPIRIGGPEREHINLNEDLSIREDGSVYVEGEYLDQIELIPFDPEVDHAKVGDNYFEPFEPEAELEASVIQGYLEGSNVDLSQEMTRLIEISRNFEAAQRIMSTNDELLHKAANELGTLR